MKRIALALMAILSASIACADDASDANAKLREYFATFNNNDIHKIATEIYATPLQTGFGPEHRVLATPEEAFEYLDTFRKEISEDGWLEFRIENVETCVMSDTLVLLDTHYSGIYEDSSESAGTTSTLLYVLKKIDDAWRIIAYYGHDHDKRPTCGDSG